MNRKSKRLLKGPSRALGVALLLTAAAANGQAPAGSPDDLIGQARTAYNDRRFEDAARTYGDYLRLYPEGRDRDEAGFFHAQSLYLAREYDPADAALAREESRNRTYQDQVLYYRGDIAAMNRDYNRALVFFDRLLGEHPDSMMAPRARTRRAETHYQVGNQYLAKNALSLAREHYRQALADAAPGLKPLIMFKLGLCHFRSGDDKSAIETWGELALLEDDAARAAALLARYRLARLFEDRDNLIQAEMNFKAFLEKAPGHFLAHFVREGLARVWAKQGRLEEAAAYWSEQGQARGALELASRFASGLEHFIHEEFPDAVRNFEWTSAQAADPALAWSARLWLARSYQAQGRADLATKLWEETLLGPASDYVKIEAARFMLGSSPARAAELARSVIEARGPYAGEAAGVRALAFSALSSPETEAVADSYLGDHPDGKLSAEVSLIRGELLLARGEFSRAEKDLAFAMNNHRDPDKQIAAAFLLSRLYQSQGRLDSAGRVLAEAQTFAARSLTPAERVAAGEAEVAYARGEYEKGLEKYEELCARPGACAPEIRFRVFWGHYRRGDFERAEQVLAELEREDPFTAGFWRGVMRLERGEDEAAVVALSALSSEDELERGLVTWKLAQAREKGGDLGAAIKLLASLEREAAGAGIFGRGEILRMALEARDFETYLANLPDPAETDQNLLSEAALLSQVRVKAAQSPPPQKELDELLAALQVAALSEDAVEEAVFIVAETRLAGPDRNAALNQMSRLLSRNPRSPFAARIRFHLGEDAFLRKNHQAAVSWLSGVRPEDLPEEHCFRLLYLAGQSFKMTRDLTKMRTCFLALAQDYADQNVNSAEWLDIGVGLILAREYTSAQTALDNVINNARDPATRAEALYWKGMSQQGAGDLDAALETFLSIARDYPDQGMWVTTALYEAAGVCAELEDYDRSLELYNQVLRRTRGDKKTTDQVRAKIAEVRKLKSQGGRLPR